MVDELGPDTNEKIQALCKKISVAHNLDAEIQEELRTHMEDKLLGYLNGEETVDEEDAFILVREHFGELSALKALTPRCSRAGISGNAFSQALSGDDRMGGSSPRLRRSCLRVHYLYLYAGLDPVLFRGTRVFTLRASPRTLATLMPVATPDN